MSNKTDYTPLFAVGLIAVAWKTGLVDRAIDYLDGFLSGLTGGPDPDEATLGEVVSGGGGATGATVGGAGGVLSDAASNRAGNVRQTSQGFFYENAGPLTATDLLKALQGAHVTRVSLWIEPGSNEFDRYEFLWIAKGITVTEIK